MRLFQVLKVLTLCLRSKLYACQKWCNLDLLHSGSGVRGFYSAFPFELNKS